MAVYRPGQGLSARATESLRARRAVLPAEDSSAQASRLLGGGAQKKPRCGVCTRPLSDSELAAQQLVCTACSMPAASLTAGDRSIERGEQPLGAKRRSPRALAVPACNFAAADTTSAGPPASEASDAPAEATAVAAVLPPWRRRGPRPLVPDASGELLKADAAATPKVEADDASTGTPASEASTLASEEVSDDPTGAPAATVLPPWRRNPRPWSQRSTAGSHGRAEDSPPDSPSGAARVAPWKAARTDQAPTPGTSYCWRPKLKPSSADAALQ